MKVLEVLMALVVALEKLTEALEVFPPPVVMKHVRLLFGKVCFVHVSPRNTRFGLQFVGSDMSLIM